MKILIIDNDESLISILTKSLTTRHNYIVDAVKNGEAGWEYGSSFEYDLIILDVQLPKLDGITLCQRFRGEGYTMPILFLSGQNTSAAKVQCLNAGADDYVVKPFDMSELCARILALLRRSSSTPLPLMSWGDLLLNPSTYEVSYNRQALTLTTKEYRLLEILLWDSQHVFSAAEILDRLWSSEEFPAEATVRSHIRRLRHKLMAAGAPSDFISTVHGRGYYLKVPEGMGVDQKADNAETQHLLPLIGGGKNLPLVLGVGLDTRISQSLMASRSMRIIMTQSVKVARMWFEEKSFPGQGDRLPQGILVQLHGASQEALDWIKMVKRDNAMLPIVVIGAHGGLTDRLEVVRHGGTLFFEPLAHPIALMGGLSKLLSQKNTAPKVMVVDHDRDWLCTLPTGLGQWGLKVTTLEDLQDFWTVFQAVLPDILVLDVNMPQTDGFEICQVLRSDLQWQALPIIFVSQLNDRQSQNQAFTVGGDDYLCKPIMITDLAPRIIGRIERQKQKASVFGTWQQ